MTKRIAEFDIWRPGYGNAVVEIFVAGTTTLADVFTDEDLSVAADNPQTLDSMMGEGGVRYGKFAASLYTGQSYWLRINGIEDTGIVRQPIASLDGEDASGALVTPTGSSYAVELSALVAQQVNVANFGSWVAGAGGVAATNTSTLELAIAALSTGGFVNIPAGLFNVNDVDIPEGVVLRGQGIDATTLKSVMGAESFTIVGDGAGFQDLTLDGNSLSTGSIGVLSENHSDVRFNSVKVTRFETCISIKGGTGFYWHDLSVVNGDTLVKLHGDGGNVLQDVMWVGGTVVLGTTFGISISYEDSQAQNITFVGVEFLECVEPAVQINGGQSIFFHNCAFDLNTKNIKILDDTAVLTPSTEQQNDTIIVQFCGGRMNGGTFEVRDTAQDVTLSDMLITGVTFTMTTPINNNIRLVNCFESGNTLTGETTKLVRQNTSDNGASFGVTTSNTATKAWSIPMDPGQRAIIKASVIAKGRNTTDKAMYELVCAAYRPGGILAFDTQTANFTVGKTLTGASSGATARITAQTDAGATGTLTLSDISGTFIDNEIITDDNGTPGSALVNGSISTQGAMIGGGSLPFDTQTANFTVGKTLTGGTSGATANIVSQTDAGTTGTLVLDQIIGAFVDNETITDNNGTPGSAAVNGTLSFTGSTGALYESDTTFDAYFMANGNEIQLMVVGASSKTIEWTADVRVVST